MIYNELIVTVIVTIVIMDVYIILYKQFCIGNYSFSVYI